MSTVNDESVDCVRPLFDKKPGAISNLQLLEVQQDREGLILKEGLIEHHDYEVVLPKVWDYLVAWHNFTDRDPILRPVRYDRKRKCPYIDLYLENNEDDDVVHILDEKLE